MKVFLNNVSYQNNYNKPLKNNINFNGNNFLDLSESEIRKRAKESITPWNFIGQGTVAKVFKIKDTDYCVRVPHYSMDRFSYRCTKDISAEDKINHIVAKLGFGATIMKFFKGITPQKYKDNEFSRDKLQKQISEMPISSYTNLLHQIAEAADNEMLFDFSGGNLIVDTENKKLTAIDFYKMPADNPRPIRPLTEMYQVLTCYGAKPDIGKKIYENIVTAALEEFKPKIIPCMDLELFDFIYLLSRRNTDHKLSGKETISQHIDKYYNIRDSVSYCLDSLKQIKKNEIRTQNEFPELEINIAKLKRLMNKIK